MAKKEHISETPATQLLRKRQVAFSEHPYQYEERGGTAVSARALGVSEHAVRISLYNMDSNEFPIVMGLRQDPFESISEEVFDGQLGSICPCFATAIRPEERQRYWGR